METGACSRDHRQHLLPLLRRTLRTLTREQNTQCLPRWHGSGDHEYVSKHVSEGKGRANPSRATANIKRMDEGMNKCMGCICMLLEAPESFESFLHWSVDWSRKLLAAGPGYLLEPFKLAFGDLAMRHWVEY